MSKKAVSVRVTKKQTVLVRDYREAIIDRMQQDREFCAAILDEMRPAPYPADRQERTPSGDNSGNGATAQFKF